MASLNIPFSTDRERLERVSRQSSQITHVDPRCTYGCAILNLTLAGLVHDFSGSLEAAVEDGRRTAPDELTDALTPIVDGESPDNLRTSGYVIHSLQTALYDGLHSETAEDAIITAVNRGGDTDTIGAITGAIAGARFGASELPERWIAEIDEVEELERLADQLIELFCCLGLGSVGENHRYVLDGPDGLATLPSIETE